MGNEKRINQINWSLIGIIIIIFILVHSMYLLINEKKGLLGEETITDEQFVIHAILNRAAASVIVFMFLFFSASNLKDLIESGDATDEQIKNQVLRTMVSAFALIAVLLELYLGVKQYVELQEQKKQ